jgi:hypothetical protein
VIRRSLLAVCALLLVTLAVAPAGATNASSGAPQGNVTPTTQPKKGVAVVAQSAPVDGQVALLVHNGSARPVRIDVVTAVATRADGGLAVSARTAASYPQVLAPDGLGLAAVTFRKRALTPGAVVTAKVRSTPVSTARAARTLSVSNLVLSAPQTGTVAQTLGATLTNGTSNWTARGPETAVMCFGEASNPTTFAKARATTRRIRPGATASVSVPLTSLCPTYLVAARAT